MVVVARRLYLARHLSTFIITLSVNCNASQFVKKYSFLSAFPMQNSDKIVISQSISRGRLTMIFTPDAWFTPRPAVGWTHVRFTRHLRNFIEYEKSQGRHLVSIASDDDFGFGVVTLEGYGIDKTIIPLFATNVLRYGLLEEHEISWLLSSRNFQVTAAAAWGLLFFYVLTEVV